MKLRRRYRKKKKKKDGRQEVLTQEIHFFKKNKIRKNN